MVLLGKKPLTLILSCICYVARNCNANLSSDSDDVSLKEALVLVDILKKEYIKVLRDNVAGIYREDNNNTIFEDQSTCAPTTIEGNYNLSHETIAHDKFAIKMTTLLSTTNMMTRSPKNIKGQAVPRQVTELHSLGGTEPDARQWSPLLPPAPQSPPLLAPLASPQVRSSEKLYEQAISQKVSPQPPPPSTPSDPLILAPQASSQGLYSSAVQYRMTPSPDFSLYEENLQRPYQEFRRRMPRDYYYYYDQRLNPRYERPWRNNFPFNSRRKNAGGENKLRFNYEYPFEANPNNRVTTTTAVLSNITTTVPSTTTKNSSNKTFVFEPSSKNNFTTRSNTPTKTYIKNENKLKYKGNIPIKSYRRKMASDPVQDQVAAELANEIENTDKPKSLENRNRRSKITAARIPTRSTRSIKKKIGFYKKEDSFLDFIKTTIRIHLERSTRYPIPFPENHAFCFTNPKSALCRTQI